MRWFRWRRREEGPNGTTKVSMYTLSICPSCNKAKKYFSDRHIPFQFTNYDLADQATQDKILQELEAEEVEAFPFVRIGDQTVQGYDPKRYAKLLGISA
ncbi:MAG TPA: glutaredoxin family protein [Terriglobales bacterium]|nr:glutaredoxin family protein [Terriglobales bacterium]